MDECPRCESFMAKNAASCRNCGWTPGQDLVAQGCQECKSKNPVHRQAHWMDYPRDALRSHLLENFPAISSKAVDLNYKLAEIAEYRDRYFHKFADEHGQWLLPGQAYLARMKTSDPIVGAALAYQAGQLYPTRAQVDEAYKISLLTEKAAQHGNIESILCDIGSRSG